jgi:LPXTG-site transpeptidase (sortase) family protein
MKKLLPLVVVILILIGTVWFFLTVVPIILVEAKYQYRNFLQTRFQVSDIRSLIIPNFKGVFDFRGDTKYKQYGISIPSIFINEPVVFNVDPNDKTTYTQALRQGIAHASGTSFPDNPGIGYYFAHSSTPEFKNQYHAIFYLLGKLKLKDEVFIWHEGKRYEYRVTSQKITQPNDVSFLQATYTKETIVLQTCWPPGTTRQRLLIFAERVTN